MVHYGALYCDGSDDDVRRFNAHAGAVFREYGCDVNNGLVQARPTRGPPGLSVRPARAFILL